MNQLQTMIDQANRRNNSGRNKQFAKRANDSQMLSHLEKLAEITVQDFEAGKPMKIAMADLKSFLAVIRSRKP